MRGSHATHAEKLNRRHDPRLHNQTSDSQKKQEDVKKNKKLRPTSVLVVFKPNLFKLMMVETSGRDCEHTLVGAKTGTLLLVQLWKGTLLYEQYLTWLAAV